MTCTRIGTAIICHQPTYSYRGFRFELHPFLGPLRLKRDGKPAQVEGKQFWRAITEFHALTAGEQEGCRI